MAAISPIETTDTPHGTVRCTVAIDVPGGLGLYYVRPEPCQAGSGALKCYRLAKCDGGDVYHVSQHTHGIECTCADWTYRRHKTGAPCKHAALGMLAERAPAVERAPRRYPEWRDPQGEF